MVFNLTRKKLLKLLSYAFIFRWCSAFIILFFISRFSLALDYALFWLIFCGVSFFDFLICFRLNQLEKNPYTHMDYVDNWDSDVRRVNKFQAIHFYKSLLSSNMEILIKEEKSFVLLAGSVLRHSEEHVVSAVLLLQRSKNLEVALEDARSKNSVLEEILDVACSFRSFHPDKKQTK
ncbi:MAG: hypothetical protein RBR08_16190 [Desulforegulaceae bacterium]|nr:hypothetical protein [Desulforegulaceae bacterium]